MKISFLLISLLSICFAYSAASPARITGGVPATLGEFPFAVTIQLSASHICGGLIYNERWILTTASCIEGISELRLLEVIVADLNFLDNFEVDQQSYPVGQIALAPELDGKAGQDDLALLEVTRPIVFGDNVNCVTIAEPEPTGSPLGVLIGYGATSTGGLASTRLRKGDVTMKGDCATWGTSFREAYMICAGSPSDTNKPCDYDFGSPLVQDGYAVGVLSQQIGCQSSPFDSSIYTKLTSYFVWIRQLATTQPDSCFRATTTAIPTEPTTTTVTPSTTPTTEPSTTSTSTPTTVTSTTETPTTITSTTETPTTVTTTETSTVTTTPTTTTTEIVYTCDNPPPFKCPLSSGYFPVYPGLCCKPYYICIDFNPALRRTCPGDLVFDPSDSSVERCIPEDECLEITKP